MAQYYRSSYIKSYQFLPDAQRTAAFLDASLRLRSVRSGDYQGMKVVQYRPFDAHLPMPARREWPQYSSGRVAFFDEDCIKVTDLRTVITRTYMPWDREVRSWILSDTFLVLTASEK